MQYPLISEYVRAIQDASSNLDKLAHLVPVLDDHGEPYRSSGAFAVVFKMQDEQTGKCYALKCFTEEQEGRAEAYRQIADELENVKSSYITSVRYLEKEIFVDSSCEEDEFPVLLMDWIDGETMEDYIAKNHKDKYSMIMLCSRFYNLAFWLRSQPFAHGDIKPDNIMICKGDKLTLIDYDGMFVPSMKGQKSPTIGTKDFSHPLRSIDDFDKTIDDFALATILLSLHAMGQNPSLFELYGSEGRLLFANNDYLSPYSSIAFKSLKQYFQRENSHLAFLLFVRSCTEMLYGQVLDRFFAVMDVFFGKVLSSLFLLQTNTYIYDELGVKYTSNGRILVSAPRNLTSYRVREGTTIIAEDAFLCCYELQKISLPESLQVIGPSAFACCLKLCEVCMPNSIFSVGKEAFWGCSSLENVTLSDSMLKISEVTFLDCEKLKSISLPQSIMYIGDRAFERCTGLENVSLPNNLVYIGENAFRVCWYLTHISLPGFLVEIGDLAFQMCELENIDVPDRVIFMGERVFFDCFDDNEEVKSKLEKLYGYEVL